ncbi:hypothetical protein Ahy_B08g093253 [Arachis hypogaea]|uniref:Uncharacterized protein n=1 Tax=Arachis hypogaea TaxID=3818 RepID=A0A444Y5J2_ARAHY|nr:hypothetical protein Ahy_B08g093253 [Arachis hypogaea]
MSITGIMCPGVTKRNTTKWSCGVWNPFLFWWISNWSANNGHVSIGMPAHIASKVEFHPQCVKNPPIEGCDSRHKSHSLAFENQANFDASTLQLKHCFLFEPSPTDPCCLVHKSLHQTCSNSRPPVPKQLTPAKETLGILNFSATWIVYGRLISETMQHAGSDNSSKIFSTGSLRRLAALKKLKALPSE